MPQVLQAERDINSVRTELLIQVFADRILVLVTQLGKVGTLIQAALPSTALIPSPGSSESSGLPPPDPSIQLTPLLGSAPSAHEQQLYSLYASQIATIIWAPRTNDMLGASRRGVIVGIALKKAGESTDEAARKFESETFLGIMKMVQELLGSK